MSIQEKHVLLITGVPGVGKTTLIRKVAELLGERVIAGFYTEEIREGGERQGFRLVTFSGEVGVIAHVGFSHTYRVGKYGVDVASIDQFAERVLAIAEQNDLYIVDEIGKMECMSSRFNGAIRNLLNANKPLIATIAKKGEGLIDEVKRRPECEMWEVNVANRDSLDTKILAWAYERT